MAATLVSHSGAALRSRMAAIGASIGADGAVDGCVLHNLSANSCLGGFPLSPGDFLIPGGHYSMSYADSVAQVDSAEPPIPVGCLAAEDDVRSADSCRAASGRAYRLRLYSGAEHGMTLVTPDLESNRLVLIQDFLEAALGLPG